MTEAIKIGDMHVKAGEKAHGMLKVLQTDVNFPVTVINGGEDGKTVLITAGVHGCEYLGIQTAIELAWELDPKDLSGTVIIANPVNPLSFRTITPAIIQEDGKNLNLVFPGERDGTISEQIAYTITHELQSKADFYIDLHGGDINEMVTPFVYYPGIAEESISEESKKIAASLNVKYMARSKATTGAYNSAAIRGLPSILIERGGRGLWNTEDVKAYKKDVLSALFQLGVIGENPYTQKTEVYEITNAIYLTAGCSGCWYPEVKAGELVEKGQKLGEIKDFFGRSRQTYFSQIQGVILYMTVSLSIDKDAPLIAYGEILE